MRYLLNKINQNISSNPRKVMGYIDKLEGTAAVVRCHEEETLLAKQDDTFLFRIHDALKVFDDGFIEKREGKIECTYGTRARLQHP